MFLIVAYNVMCVMQEILVWFHYKDKANQSGLSKITNTGLILINMTNELKVFS